jgi:hypothetical protein
MDAGRVRRPAAIACLVLLAACGSAAPTQSASSRPTVTGVPQPSAPPTPTPIPFPKAPAIVQVENSEFGRPQSGLGSANIVYEYVAEGGIGRFSLLFFGQPKAAQQVGPVRSVRTVTVRLAQIYQGLIAFSGASTYIYSQLRASGVPYFDEDHAGGSLFRLSTRAAPHNLYTDGQHIAFLSGRAGSPDATYTLWPRTSAPAPGGTPVTSFTARISQSEQPVFTWDAALQGFRRTEATGAVVDPGTRQPVVIPTVIVQQVAVTTDPNVHDVNGTLGVDHGITGTGRAQVFTGGLQYAATWTQPAHGPPQFTLADGSPAPIAPGEVWISLVPIGQPAQ